ncbi:MAG TPA: 3D domain-containing protein [Gaiellaceae bacterium]|nr:3D domain-containing protein [Gaiellaceae bacterium]
MSRQEPHFRPRLTWLALLALAAVSVPAALGAGGPSVQSLRQRDQALAARSRSAVLGLYALQTKLARAQAELAAYEGRAATLRRERAAVAAQLHVARLGITISQRRLATRIRALYEQGSVDPLAVVLGAESLDAAMTTLDGLGQMANGDKKVLAQLKGARSFLGALRLRLSERQRRLDAIVRATAATTRSLAGTETEHRTYLAGLSAQRRLTQAAIRRLESQARAAQAKAQTLELASTSSAALDTTTTTAAPTTDASRDPAAASATGDPTAVPATAAQSTASTGRTITVVATGYSLPGRTATGLPVGWGVVAVDPSVIPLGARFSIPGYGEGVAADIGGGVRGTTIDLWFPTVAQAQAWGRRAVTISLH